MLISDTKTKLDQISISKPKILCIYASIGGNTELVVQFVAQVLAQNNFELQMLRAEVVGKQLAQNSELLVSYDTVIFASPTYKQGSLEDQFTGFLKTLKKIAPTALNDKNMAIIGLGDNRYYPEYLTESATILETEVKNLGGILVCPSLRVGMPPIKYLNSIVKNWAQKLAIILANNLTNKLADNLKTDLVEKSQVIS